MRKLFTVIVYTIVILLIGRNLAMLPRFYLFTTKQEEQDSFSANLKKQTEEIIKNKTGNYGVYYADMNGPYKFAINDKEIFTAASVNKIPIVAVLYYLDNKNKIDLDEKITLQESDIQAYGTGSLQHQKPGAVYSLKTLAKLAIKQSDNTAAYIIAQRIGVPTIQKTIDSWGLTQTDMANNKTSAHDMFLLFKKIYDAKITTPAKTQELFGFMIDTDIEDRLPAKLPANINIYHKSGDAVGSIHDVGIIQKDGTVFFLAVLTSDIGNKETETKDTIAEIAKNIYESSFKIEK